MRQATSTAAAVDAQDVDTAAGLHDREVRLLVRPADRA